MRRIGFAIASLAAVVGILAASAGAEDKRTYQAELFNAFGLVDGSELRVAGVPAGKVTGLDITPEKTALVTFEVGPGFPELKADATCSSEPQSLIAEYFLDCQPGTSDDPLEEPIAASRNQITVQNDLVQNTLREPFKRRLALLINEFGTALVGNEENLNAAIRSGAPALREFRKVLKILGRQNRLIAQLNTDSDTVFARLTERREDVVRFIDEAEDTARVSADRRADLSRDFDLLDDFLVELRPTMVELGNLAREQTPLLTDLRAAAPGLNRLGKTLPRFNNGARVSLNALGGASDVGRRSLIKARDEINQLNETSLKGPKAANLLAEFLQHADDPVNAVEETSRARDDLSAQPGEADRRVALLEQELGADLDNPGYTALEGLLNYGYTQTTALNLYDLQGHGLGVSIMGALEAAGECGHTATGSFGDTPDYPARGGGHTSNVKDALGCIAQLGDMQPGITPGTYDPVTGLTGNLPRYDDSVCPAGSTHLTICDPTISTSSGSLRTASTGTGTGAAPAPAAPQPQPPTAEEVEEVAKEIEESGEVPTTDEILEGLGLPPGSVLPPEVIEGIEGLVPTAPGASSSDRANPQDMATLLDYLLGP